MASPDEEVTRLLERLRSGDSRAGEQLLPLVYRELHTIAERLMGDQRAGHTLQPTALVNEAWLRLAGGSGLPQVDGQFHFLRVAARAMRNVLVDHARAKQAAKRGGRPADGVDLDEAFLEAWHDALEDRNVDVLALNEALEKLGEIDETSMRVVELRYFAGLTIPEVANVLEVSTNTVDRKWRMARVWLGKEMIAPGDA